MQSARAGAWAGAQAGARCGRGCLHKRQSGNAGVGGVKFIHLRHARRVCLCLRRLRRPLHPRRVHLLQPSAPAEAQPRRSAALCAPCDRLEPRAIEGSGEGARAGAEELLVARQVARRRRWRRRQRLSARIRHAVHVVVAARPRRTPVYAALVTVGAATPPAGRVVARLAARARPPATTRQRPHVFCDVPLDHRTQLCVVQAMLLAELLGQLPRVRAREDVAVRVRRRPVVASATISRLGVAAHVCARARRRVCTERRLHDALLAIGELHRHLEDDLLRTRRPCALLWRARARHLRRALRRHGPTCSYYEKEARRCERAVGLGLVATAGGAWRRGAAWK